MPDAQKEIAIRITTTADVAGAKEIEQHLESLKKKGDGASGEAAIPLPKGDFVELLKRLGSSFEQLGAKSKVAGDSFSIFGERRAALHLGEIAGDLATGASAADVFSNSIFRAEYALGRAFVPLLAVAGLHSLYTATKKSSDEFEKLRIEIDKLSVPLDAFSGVANLNAHLQAILPQLQRIRNEVLNTIPSFSEYAYALLHGTTVSEERNRQLLELLSAAKTEAGALVQQYQIAAGIEKEMVEGSEKFSGSTEEAVELDQAHLDTLLKQAAIYEQFKDPSLFAQRDEALKAESDRYNAHIQLINKKHDLLRGELDLHEKILDINQRVQDAQITANAGKLQGLQAKIDEASRKEFNAPEGSEERRKAHLEGVAATQALEDERLRQFRAGGGSLSRGLLQDQAERRRLDIEKKNLDSQTRDLEDRINRGAYGQSELGGPAFHGGIPDVGRSHESFRTGGAEERDEQREREFDRAFHPERAATTPEQLSSQEPEVPDKHEEGQPAKSTSIAGSMDRLAAALEKFNMETLKPLPPGQQPIGAPLGAPQGQQQWAEHLLNVLGRLEHALGP